MGKKLVPFWEDTYRDNSVSTFAITPNPTVKEFEHPNVPKHLHASDKIVARRIE